MATGRQIQKKGQSKSTPTSGMFQPRPFAEPAQPESVTAPEQTQVEASQTGGNLLSRVTFSAPPPPIQPKLTIGEPNDKYEQEADTVAKQVMKKISTSASPDEGSGGGGDGSVQRQMFSKPLISRLTVQRREAIEGGEASSHLESRINQAKTGGRHLETPLRRKMEGAFGTDFSKVNIYNDSTADRLNRSLSARAFTTGNNIFFKRGEYNPNSSSGQELLAHELTHVVQQGGEIQRTPAIQREKIETKVFTEIIQWLTHKASSQENVALFSQFLSLKQEVQEEILCQINGDAYAPETPTSLAEFKPKLKLGKSSGKDVDWNLFAGRVNSFLHFRPEAIADKNSNVIDDNILEEFLAYLERKAEKQEHKDLINYIKELPRDTKEKAYLYLAKGKTNNSFETFDKKSIKGGWRSYIPFTGGGAKIDWEKISRTFIHASKDTSEEAQIFGGRTAGGLTPSVGIVRTGVNFVSDVTGLKNATDKQLSNEDRATGLADMAGFVISPVALASNLAKVQISENRMWAAHDLQKSKNEEISQTATVMKDIQSLNRSKAAIDSVKCGIKLFAPDAFLIGIAISVVFAIIKGVFAWKTMGVIRENLVDKMFGIEHIESKAREKLRNQALQSQGFATPQQCYEEYVAKMAIRLNKVGVLRQEGNLNEQKEASTMITDVMGLRLEPEKQIPNPPRIAEAMGW
ncbi:DUF4157 domain-containing protein [Ancylothrix sp. C2]|uniref:eCIS core domain-containing protein n=1 Tax=Ancylothrix sp. D3o TaxID=2953691 RepID=UPI0021BADBB6|nr:DUF4157 domain-containing protein [Ancylothrix sp. D3o]MCT7948239.1 DUF4157 domain-containing protein [Ancylothrix sp. D3o]